MNAITRLDNGVLLSQSIVLINVPVKKESQQWAQQIKVWGYHVLGFPRVANPDILSSDRSVVTTTLHHVSGQNTLLRLVFVL
jgi:hypothetical protein